MWGVRYGRTHEGVRAEPLLSHPPSGKSPFKRHLNSRREEPGRPWRCVWGGIGRLGLGHPGAPVGFTPCPPSKALLPHQ